jgi:hypothetical protein
MEMMEFECFGGPMDGQRMPIPDEAEMACGVAVDKETGEPHFYVLSKRLNVDNIGETSVLEYFGSNPFRVIERLRAIASPLADQIESEICGNNDEGEDWSEDDDD